MPSRSKTAMPKRQRQQSSRRLRNAVQINIPQDLCLPGDITAGFGLFEPITGFQSTLLAAADVKASPKSLAADSLSHLVEGWRYLSSAIYAFVAHSSGPSIHQAYYAELRAVFSLFAASGIRVKYPLHAYVNNAGVCARPTWEKTRTHTLAWELWKVWIRGRYAESLFLDDLKIHPSITVRQLQRCIQAQPTASLQLWGFDLANLVDDHSARNTASYEPYWSNTQLSSMRDDDFKFVTELWGLLQPTVTGQQFEISLIHYLIDLDIAERHRADPQNFYEEHWYNALISSLNADTGVGCNEISYLLQNRNSSMRPFYLANESKTEAKNVLSRALFLLRLATLAAEKSFAAFPGSNGKYWVKNWLIHAGIWDEKAVPDPSDIWDDFSVLISVASPGEPLPYKLFNHKLPETLLAKIVRPDASLAWSLQL